MPMLNTIASPFNNAPLIQGLWIGKLGMLERLSMKSFLAQGHSYHLYAYDDLEGVPEGVVLKDASEIIPEKDVFQYQRGKAKGGYSGFANLFRYRLLQLKGGWWCDTDIICLKTFDFNDEIVLASERHWLWPNKICNNVMYCPPGHLLADRCYKDALQYDPNKMKFAANGEPVVTRNVRALGLEKYVKPPETFNPIDWYLSTIISKKIEEYKIPASSYSIHCYRETWRWRLKDHQGDGFRNRIFAPGTLLGDLQRKYLFEEVN